MRAPAHADTAGGGGGVVRRLYIDYRRYSRTDSVAPALFEPSRLRAIRARQIRYNDDVQVEYYNKCIHIRPTRVQYCVLYELDYVSQPRDVRYRCIKYIMTT